MLEFAFFNRQPCQQFLDLAQDLGTECSVNHTYDSFIVQLSEDIEDDVLDKLELRYDELMTRDQSLVEQSENDEEQHTAGITVQLQDGRNVYAKVSPSLLSKVMQSISNEELNALVNAITEAVETPDASSLCQR
jgi:hypothetical protein